MPKQFAYLLPNQLHGGIAAIALFCHSLSLQQWPQSRCFPQGRGSDLCIRSHLAFSGKNGSRYKESKHQKPWALTLFWAFLIGIWITWTVFILSCHLYFAIGKAFLWSRIARFSCVLCIGGPCPMSRSLSASKETPNAELLVEPGLRKTAIRSSLPYFF